MTSTYIILRRELEMHRCDFVPQHISAGSCRIFAYRGMRIMEQINPSFCAENPSLLKNLTYFIGRLVIVPIQRKNNVGDLYS